MAKITLSQDLIVEIGRLLGEDFDRFGKHPFERGNAEGLFTEAFVQSTKAEFADDDADLFIVEDYEAIGFFKGVKPTEAARKMDLIYNPGFLLFAGLITEAKERAEKAMAKYPQPNYVLTKFAEESGEVVKECVHYAEGRGNWDFVRYEMIDTLAMMMRLLAEGDQVHGFIPPHLKDKGEEDSDYV